MVDTHESLLAITVNESGNGLLPFNIGFPAWMRVGNCFLISFRARALETNTTRRTQGSRRSRCSAALSCERVAPVLKKTRIVVERARVALVAVVVGDALLLPQPARSMAAKIAARRSVPFVSNRVARAAIVSFGRALV
jgi:hypothetical protein